MAMSDFELAEDETILFEEGPAVLTDKRVLLDHIGRKDGSEWEEIPLSQIATVKIKNGGNESRLNVALQLGAIGFAFVLAEAVLPRLIPNLHYLVDSLLFLVGAMGLLTSGYLLLSSLFRVKPHTMFSLVVVGERDKTVSFPGFDSSAAEELSRLFKRAKRRRPLES